MHDSKEWARRPVLSMKYIQGDSEAHSDVDLLHNAVFTWYQIFIITVGAQSLRLSWKPRTNLRSVPAFEITHVLSCSRRHEGGVRPVGNWWFESYSSQRMSLSNRTKELQVRQRISDFICVQIARNCLRDNNRGTYIQRTTWMYACLIADLWISNIYR